VKTRRALARISHTHSSRAVWSTTHARRVGTFADVRTRHHVVGPATVSR
jgi:hypothetical protein